jgi:hypothetical protein
MSLTDFLHRLAAAMDRAAVPYMLAGSVASSIHGQPRSTQDVDLVIHTDPAGIRRLVNELPDEDYYVDVDVALQALRRSSQFNVIDMETGWKADLIIRKARPFSQAEFDRRRRIQMDGEPIWIASPEDVVITKLEWAKRTESERQLRDVAGVLAERNDIDTAYIERWVAELELQHQWNAVQGES